MREPDRGIDAPARRAHGLGLFTRAQRVLEDEARELLPRAPVAADGARGLGVVAERQERLGQLDARRRVLGLRRGGCV
jgi:hypothetical protein